MHLTTEEKKKVFKKYGNSETDTGSAESQIALFTERISHLTGHLKANKHDFFTQRALQNLVGQRKGLLSYLMKKDIERYRAIVKKLKLRK